MLAGQVMVTEMSALVVALATVAVNGPAVAVPAALVAVTE
jgi:hypothetical protein